MSAKTVEVLVLPDGRMDRHNAAIYLGSAEKTLAQWVSKGVGPKYVKRGRVWYFKEDVDAWLSEGKIKRKSLELVGSK